MLLVCVYAVGSNLQKLALSLALKCLTFDFMGTSVDESSEEFGSIQVFFHDMLCSCTCVICVAQL